MVNLSFASSIAFYFPSVKKLQNAFMFFTISSCFGLVFLVIYVVESKNKSMEDIWREMGIKDIDPSEKPLVEDCDKSYLETNDYSQAEILYR